VPADNAYSESRSELGRKLFFDAAMSRNYTVSCASCHLPEFAFSDTSAFSAGDLGAAGTSNTPPLFNLAWHPYYTRAGGVATLEMQVNIPVQEHNEFNMNMLELVERLSADPEYQAMSTDAYERPLDAWVITRALANFERTLVSGNSRYDQAMHQPRTYSLTESEERGRSLFFSDRLQCASCHGGFNFTNYAFENNGLYEVYADSGRMRLTHFESDRARFKVPSLRNVAVTAPYMHDGSLKTLYDVIDHYNKGGYPHQNKSPLIRPLGLTATERTDLVAFLKSLTDIHYQSSLHD
jgi:cytochrome c peroxidase